MASRRKKIKKPSIDFDLRQLEIFCKVVELQSFSKAAKAVFLAQASVSERIASLEAMVGTRLLDRLGRTVTPTAAGKHLYDRALALLDMKKTICLEMEDFLGLKRGEIKIGGSTIPGEYILPKIIEEFRCSYPEITVSLIVGDSEEIESKVLEGSLELGVIGSKDSGKTIEYRELWQDELLVVVPSSHPLAMRKQIQSDDLFHHPFIIRESGSGTLKIFRSHLLKKGKHISDLNVVAKFGSSTAVKEGIKAGLGISILSSRAVETELKIGVLRALRIKGLPMHRKFYLIRDKRRTLSPLCKAMINFLIQ